jgi:hypothetical protein
VLTTKLSVVGVVATMVDGSQRKSSKERAFIGFFKNFFKILFQIQKLDEDLVLKEFAMTTFFNSFLSKRIRNKLFLTGSTKLKFYISLILYGFYKDAMWRVNETQLSFAKNNSQNFYLSTKNNLKFFNNFEGQDKFLKITTMLAIRSRIYSNIRVTVIRN